MNACMIDKIFEEWLRWFDSQMVDRKVVLLMDSFSAHESAVRTINDSSTPLQNTLIIWLPSHSTNATSQFQPLDHGIIKTWKAHWKRQWIQYMVAEHDQGHDPVESMNVPKALRWAIRAWELDISAQSIRNCFGKALFEKDSDQAQAEQQLMDEIRVDFDALRPHITNPMSIENFLNPMDEVVQDDLDTLDDIVLSQFSGHPEFDDDSESMPEVPLIRIDEAIKALEMLLLYEQQQAEGDKAVISSLLKHERVIQARKSASRNQADIRRFFG